MVPFKLLTKTTLEIEHVVKATSTNPLYEPYSKLIQRASGHDGRRIQAEYYDEAQNKKKSVEYWTTFSSSKEKKNFFSPLGATFFSKHNNGEKMTLQWKSLYALLKETLTKI